MAYESMEVEINVELSEEDFNRIKKKLNEIAKFVKKTREKLFEFEKLIDVETSNLTNGYPLKLIKKGFGEMLEKQCFSACQKSEDFLAC